jgi:hypothetical protein
MPRLRNTRTGVVVNVADDKVRTLQGYEPADAPAKTETKAPAKKASSKK